MELSDELKLGGQSLSYLNETRKWTMFLSIVGFVAVGILLIAAFFVTSIMNSFPDQAGNSLPEGMSGILSAVYIVMAILYFFPVYYLYKFSENMKMGIAHRADTYVETAFGYLKSHYKFMGILTAIVLVFYAMIFIGSFLIASLM